MKIRHLPTRVVMDSMPASAVAYMVSALLDPKAEILDEAAQDVNRFLSDAAQVLAQAVITLASNSTRDLRV